MSSQVSVGPREDDQIRMVFALVVFVFQKKVPTQYWAISLVQYFIRLHFNAYEHYLMDVEKWTEPMVKDRGDLKEQIRCSLNKTRQDIITRTVQ